MGSNLLPNFAMFYRNSEYRRVATNVLSLGTIQVTNYLVPLILLPYLVQTLGLSVYGVIVFAQTIIGYFESIMQYSFSLTAVHEISQYAKNKTKQQYVVNKVLTAKCILALISASLIVLLAFTVPRFQEIRFLLILGILYCLAYCLNFDWFFQGIQEMNHLTYLNLLARLFSIVWVFTMVKSNDDLIFAFLTVPIGYLITGIVSLVILKFKYKISFYFIHWSSAWREIKRGFHVFYAQILVRFYSADVNITILGFVSDSASVGVYALANRIIGIFMVATNLITVIVFPYLANLYKNNLHSYRSRTIQVYKYTFVIFAILSACIFFSAHWIVTFVNGSSNVAAETCLRILAVALLLSPFAPLNNQIFIINNRSRWLAVISSIAVVLNLALFYPAYYLYQLQGLAILNVTVFAVLVFTGVYILRHQQIFFNSKSGEGF